MEMIDWGAEPNIAELKKLRQMISLAPAEAVCGFEKLAALGSQMSLFYLGEAYRTGHGVTKDLRKAEEYYRLSADAGSVHGAYGLGMVYRFRDQYEKAFDVLAFCDLRDFSPALRLLGWMHFKGRGTKIDTQKAIYYWERAAKLGHVKSKVDLSSIYLSGRYGISNILRGLIIWISAAVSIPLILLADPYSDKFRR